MPHGQWAHNTIVQLSINAAVASQRIVNVHHFEATTPQETAMLSDTAKITACQGLIDLWQAAALTQWRACHNGPYVINMIRAQVIQVRNMVDRVLAPVEEPMTTGNTGTEASSFVEDLTSSIIVKWRSNVAGKAHRGRTYIGPVPDPWNATSGMVAAAGVTAATNYGTIMVNTFGLSGTDPNWRLTIYSRPYNYQEYGYVRGSGAGRHFYFPPDYDGDSTNVVAHAVDPILRTQRRRQVGVGV